MKETNANGKKALKLSISTSGSYAQTYTHIVNYRLDNKNLFKLPALPMIM